MTDQAFSAEQQEYLKGFMAGVEAKRGPFATGTAAAPDPDDLQRAAQDRAVADGGRLVPEEEAKRKKHPLDRFAEISALAAEQKFPKGTDVFLTKYHGLFYVAPAQNSFMCRLRMPGGILDTRQFRGVGRYRGRTRRRLRGRHHAGEPAGARDRCGPRAGGVDQAGRSRADLARVRCRQRAQRDRQPDRRDRRAGAARHAGGCAPHPSPHPEPPRAVRAAAQVQHRVRRLGHNPGAGGHERRGVHRGARGGRVRRGARDLLPAGAGRHHGPPGLCAADRRDRDAGRDDAGV